MENNNSRKIGIVNEYGEICLTDDEIQALLNDFDLLEDEDIEQINNWLSIDREAIVFNKANNPYFDKYIENLLMSPIEIVQRKHCFPDIRGGVINKIDYYQKRQYKRYQDCVMYHYNARLLNEIQDIVGFKNHTQVIKDQNINPRPKLRTNRQGKTTDNEIKYFTKAIEAGLMIQDGEGYRWIHNNGLKASLGYFLHRVFNPKGTTQIPYQRLEALFSVTRLDSAIDQALTAKKPQKWRKEIYILFDD